MAVGKGSATPTLKTALIRKKILQMRQEGFSFERIAAELGCSYTYARKQFLKALNSIVVEDVEAVRKLEMQKLDALEAEIYSVLKAFMPYVSNGRIVTELLVDDNGNPVVNDNGKPVYVKVRDLGAKLQSVDRLIKVMERRARLLGLDKPSKVAATDPDGNPVPFITPTMSLEEAAAVYAESREDNAVFETNGDLAS